MGPRSDEREEGLALQLREQVRLFFQERLPDRPDYELRPQQLEMALAVATAIEDEELLVVEAGTGTGKSLAYLIPSLLWALHYQRPVVISTRTLNLQQQLMEKDIPLLRQLSPYPFRATTARGWSNYLCLRRLEALQNREQAADELAEEASALSARLAQSDLPAVRQALQVSDALWSQVQAESAACNRQHCPHYQDCYLFRERREMERSQLIIANHSLVMADLALRQEGANGILPSPAAWVMDEAHHLEEVANDHLGRSLSRGQLRRLRQHVYEPKGKSEEAGWLPALRQRLARMGLQTDLHGELLDLLDRGLLGSLPGFYDSGEEFFYWLDQLVQSLPGDGRVTLDGSFLKNPMGERCLESSSLWAASLEQLSASARNLLGKLQDHELDAQHGGQAELKSLVERLRTMRDNLEFCLFPESRDWVYWAQVTPEDIELGATPLDVGERLAQTFFAPARSLVATSATLAVSNQDLTFFQQRVGLDRVSERVRQLCLSSPFAFEEMAYLGVATDLSDPNRPEFWLQAQASLVELVVRLGGRCFLLGTSFISLRQAQEALQAPLAQAGIRLLRQGEAPAGQLLSQFRANPRSLLLGADSFWEGVDVPGEDLVCVILTRLPFRVPSDPLVQAHCRRIEEDGGNSFSDYQKPQAILKFRQGFGRLIRTQRDRGMVLVLDSRLYHKGYGKDFLQALPRCRRRAGRLAGLVEDAWSWFCQRQEGSLGVGK